MHASAKELKAVRPQGAKEQERKRPGRERRQGLASPPHKIESLRPGIPAYDSVPPSKRKEVQRLLELGAKRGFLTYDEVNDALTPEMVTSEQIDDLMVLFGQHSIEVVVAASQASRAKAAPAAAEPLARQRAAAARASGVSVGAALGARRERDVEVERPGPHVPAQDGLGLAAHPRGRGRDRQAHRDGESTVFEVILNSRVGIAEILSIGDNLKKGKIRVKDIVKDFDANEENQPDEEEVIKRVLSLLEKVRRLEAQNNKLREELAHAQDRPRGRRRPRRQIEHNQKELVRVDARGASSPRS